MYTNRSSNCFSTRARITLIQTLVLSIMNYGIKIWGTTNITHAQQIQRLQSFAAKVALGSCAKFDHATLFLRELGWLKIHQKYKYVLGIISYNIIHGNIPNHLFVFPRVSDVCSFPTRQQHNFYESKINTSTGTRSLLVAWTKFWNSLPTSVRNAHSMLSFKKLLFTHLFKRQFTE